MTILLYKLIEVITNLNEKILSWNDAYEYNFTDKQLHFIVIGVVGMAFLTVIHPLFKHLAAKRMVLAISWIYDVTLLIVITFAIEIGQRLTKTGTMDFRDIIYGMGGFFLMFGIFYVIRLIVKLIAGLLHRDEKNREAAAQ